jgi:hypothetical protein
MIRTTLAIAGTAGALVLWHHRWLTRHRLQDQLLDERAHVLHQRARRLDRRETDIREQARQVHAEHTIRRAFGITDEGPADDFPDPPAGYFIHKRIPGAAS